MDDNLRIFDTVETGIMTPEEIQLMKDVQKAYISRTKIGCTGCRYCMPCPNGVDIPGTFAIWNDTSLFGGDPKKNWHMQNMIKADSIPTKCIGCGACEAACPQHLSIIENLQTAWKELNG